LEEAGVNFREAFLQGNTIAIFVSVADARKIWTTCLRVENYRKICIFQQAELFLDNIFEGGKLSPNLHFSTF
jgi:hypothetical protein